MPWKVEFPALFRRLVFFLLLFSLVVIFLLILGSFQSFEDANLKGLFQLAETTCWVGLLFSLISFVLSRKNGHFSLTQSVAPGLAFLAFAVLFVLLQFVGVWLY